MNISCSQRALWSLALGSILTLGFGTQASARDNPRDLAGEEEAEAEVGERENRKGRGGRQRAAAADQAAPRQDAVRQDAQHRQAAQHEAVRRNDAQRQRVRPRQEVQRPQAEQLARHRGDQERAARQAVEARQAAHADRRDVEQRAARRQIEARQVAPRPQVVQGQQRRDDMRRPDNRKQQQRLSREQQEQRIRAERHRADRYHQSHTQRSQRAEHRARQLQQQRRMAQYRYEQHYLQRLRQQQTSWNARRYNPYNDQYFHTPASYRYSYGGGYRETNRYGADLMRQAVNYGYREGLRAGQADRQDGWRSDYRNSYGYQDASYGYDGYYVEQDVYNHYFRQGFQRGYQDGHSSNYRYGRRDNNGSYGMLAGVLSMSLGLQVLN